MERQTKVGILIKRGLVRVDRGDVLCMKMASFPYVIMAVIFNAAVMEGTYTEFVMCDSICQQSPRRLGLIHFVITMYRQQPWSTD